MKKRNVLTVILILCGSFVYFVVFSGFGKYLKGILVDLRVFVLRVKFFFISNLSLSLFIAPRRPQSRILAARDKHKKCFFVILIKCYLIEINVIFLIHLERLF